MEVICLEEQSFYALIDKVVEHVDAKYEDVEDQWIDDAEAMRVLRIKSSTTLQKLRDEGKVRFTQPSKKIILYDRQSILDHLDNHSHDTF